MTNTIKTGPWPATTGLNSPLTHQSSLSMSSSSSTGPTSPLTTSPQLSFTSDDSGNKMEQQPDTKLVEETVAVAMSETTFRFFVLNATKTTVRSNP
ncbi:unnamed protein product [Ilex paraguariensis]|uniref:Uncharacterized protein n=1 Tax=Ilex paraguariensis TaxID=185542 RepID=A0ABC8U1U4_9AQUA